MSTQPTSEKPQPNIYTVMLGLAAVFMLMAVILMIVELQRYSNYGYWQVNQAIPNVSQ